ncbi:type VI secretion system tip protein VgrG [Psychrobacter sp. N25K4-3-2]|uniref:contractile injection system protein, VgrG/Pvc8 family n=1 Tax=Psychrobacter sp. N25K4-3-2 TaxID=2785026 RepID=UPI001889D6D1|nr:contractile injection system protein, VgrG/Pvc8 family [Psychrobacter sp. N25K4-3-2]MBF4488777.1 type VI secretion system tip protein VgrG [Psychrobacter sp. N25K4-3-2]
MVWTQTKRHVQLSSAHPDIATSIIQQADLVESLLGMPLPDSVWGKPALMPAPDAYPSPYHHDQRVQSYTDRQLALFSGYRISITLLHPQAGLDIQQWLGQKLAMHWHTGDAILPSQTRHGIITEAVALGSNSGMAAYRIICEPTVSQLRLNSHNRRHHHLSLSELIKDIISPYDIDVEIDERLSDDSSYHIQHSVQYNQTDLAYLTQYLALYGITGYYRHEADKHTLVLLPSDGEILRPDTNNIQSILSQNPANLADRQDRITTIRPRIAQHIQQSDLHRYDSRLMSTYTGSSSSEQPIDSSSSTHQRFLHSHSRFDDKGLDKLATRYQQHAQQLANLGSLTGNIRHLSLPSSHYIDGNPYLTDPISLVSIHQHINNHIPADWLGAVAFDPITLQPNTNHANDNDDDNVHHINACYLPFPHHHHIPYGEQLATLGQPHPSLTGLMSASIIDTDSSAITHDRNHRAHIRYHWQQEEDGQDNNSDSGHWIPIASHLVADHMGQTHPLRHGQHVLIDFIGGDITHPIIIGSTHNGQGNSDAQHNSIVSDTDTIDATSPAWFINQSHAYPIDGIKTQSIDSSRTGDATKDSLINGYNQLMFDAHPESPQINVYSSSFQSSLTIGHLYQHTDHTRGQARGQGISIETQAAANVQGSTGIHISSSQSDPSSNPHMSHDRHGKLQTADQHQQAYAQLAETHQPVGLEGSSDNKQSKDKSNKEESQTPFAQFSKDTNDATLSESGQWQQSHLLIDSQRHLAMLSGQHSQHTSTQSTHSHATDSTHHHSQTQMNQLVAGDIHYYSNKAQTHTAAHGDVIIQAHQEQMRLDSEQVLRLHSRDSIEIIAPDTLTLKAAGSGIEISGGNVTFITPAQVGYKASRVDWGNGGGRSPTITMPQDELADCAAKTGSAGNKGGAV